MVAERCLLGPVGRGETERDFPSLPALLQLSKEAAYLSADLRVPSPPLPCLASLPVASTGGRLLPSSPIPRTGCASFLVTQRCPGGALAAERGEGKVSTPAPPAVGPEPLQWNRAGAGSGGKMNEVYLVFYQVTHPWPEILGPQPCGYTVPLQEKPPSARSTASIPPAEVSKVWNQGRPGMS